MAGKAAKRTARAKRKVAIVTGGGTGLGRSCANVLTREGYAVAIVGRRAAKLKPKRGETLYPYVCDVADRAQIRATVKAVLADFGRLDALVNGAGSVRIKKAENVTQDDIDSLIGTNLVGTMNFCYACVPALRKARGTIVNMSSSIAYRPSAESSIYAATKGGVESFTKALAVELAPRVRVNTVSPGLVRSEVYLAAGMGAKTYKNLLKWAGSLYLMGRAGEPEDVAELVAFLASDKASWITGLCIPVDGGYSVGQTIEVPRTELHGS